MRKPGTPDPVVDQKEDSTEEELNEDTDDGIDSKLEEELDSTEEEKREDGNGDRNTNTRNDPSLGLEQDKDHPDKRANPTISTDH